MCVFNSFCALLIVFVRYAYNLTRLETRIKKIPIVFIYAAEYKLCLTSTTDLPFVKWDKIEEIHLDSAKTISSRIWLHEQTADKMIV